MEKVVRNGMVAVLYSPGYGAGFYSWNTDYPGLIFDPVIVNMIELDNFDGFDEYVEKTYPDAYVSSSSLAIEWVPVGTKFCIDEYDGSESVVLMNEDTFFEA
jgi:hypothetical protein